MKVKTLENTEYANFYSTYINKVPQDLDLLDAYKIGKTKVLGVFKSISEEKSKYRYAEGKWSIREVFQHIIDNERIFTYRCLRIARRDKTPLAGYEQNDYIPSSKAHQKPMEVLIKEYEVVRENSILLLQSLDTDDLKAMGNVSGGEMSARAAAFITIGHEIHHINVINERYL